MQDLPLSMQPRVSSHPRQGVLFSYFEASFFAAQVMVLPEEKQIQLEAAPKGSPVLAGGGCSVPHAS